jgi:hypothetical protein
MEKQDFESESCQKPQKPGTGIDRTVMRRLLKLTPMERLKLAAAEARNMALFDSKIRR